MTASPGLPRTKQGSCRACRFGVGGPSEIANAFVFLATDKASYISAHVLSVDERKSAV